MHISHYVYYCSLWNHNQKHLSFLTCLVSVFFLWGRTSCISEGVPAKHLGFPTELIFNALPPSLGVTGCYANSWELDLCCVLSHVCKELWRKDLRVKALPFSFLHNSTTAMTTASSTKLYQLFVVFFWRENVIKRPGYVAVKWITYWSDTEKHWNYHLTGVTQPTFEFTKIKEQLRI